MPMLCAQVIETIQDDQLDVIVGLFNGKVNVGGRGS